MDPCALAHYNDFGHTLIYLMHVRRLIERLGTDVQQVQELERPLLLAWLRSLILATREDLLPDFRHYADALAAWPVSARPGNANSDANASANPNAQPSAHPGTPPGPDAFEGQSVRHVLDATLAAAGNAPLDVYFALMEASARHLLRFDERHALRTDNSVADNVGWLDFTHALTFGHALHQQCARLPHLWPQGLLQLAMFVGRNSGYLNPGIAAQTAIREWAVTDEAAFHERAIATIVGDRTAHLPCPLAEDLERSAGRREPAVSRALQAAARIAHGTSGAGVCWEGRLGKARR